MTKEQLLQLSEDTFLDNTAGAIMPEAHRQFIESLIDTLMPDWETLTVLSYEKLETPPVGLAYKDYGDFILLKGGIQPTSEGTKYIRITVSENFSEHYIGLFYDSDGPNGEGYTVSILNNNTININVLNADFTFYEDSFNFSAILTKNVDNYNQAS